MYVLVKKYVLSLFFIFIGLILNVMVKRIVFWIVKDGIVGNDIV